MGYLRIVKNMVIRQFLETDRQGLLLLLECLKQHMVHRNRPGQYRNGELFRTVGQGPASILGNRRPHSRVQQLMPPCRPVCLLDIA